MSRFSGKVAPEEEQEGERSIDYFSHHCDRLSGRGNYRAQYIKARKIGHLAPLMAGAACKSSHIVTSEKK